MGGGAVALAQTAILWACVALLSVIGAVYAYRLAERVWGALRGRLSGFQLVAFIVVAGVCSWAAQKYNVRFPRTDPQISYLTDRGSYSTEDSVHIDFTRIIVPDTATWYLDRRGLSSTNDADWVTFASGTFAEWRPPLDLPCENATNYNFMVYTDWTPGPSVVTNGVWHAMWGKDQKRMAFFIPLRTAVRVDGEVIATPKSKEDANER